MGLDQVLTPFEGLEQFRHVAKWENGGKGSVHICREMLAESAPTSIRVGGWYSVLLPCGSVEELPVMTLTGLPESTVPPRPPSAAYADTVKRGLRETYPGMKDLEIEKYIQRATFQLP